MIIRKPNLYLIKRRLKFCWQRITRGWTDEDTWSLDYVIAKFSLPRIKRFKELQNGFPSGIAEKEWDEILDKIILAFELIDDDFHGKTNFKNAAEIRQRDIHIETGVTLFGKHFRQLWW